MPGDLAALVVNFNTAELTLRSIESILAAGVARVWVLDNGSDAVDRRRLAEGVRQWPGVVERIQEQCNLGFAQGCNILFERALADPGIGHVLLLNSDAVLLEGGLDRLRSAAATGAAMVGGRVDCFPDGPDGQELESLGITLYRSLLASNRKRATDALVGPTGACALYTRELLLDLKASHGYIFDPDYFCYAEDTDLCIRARLLGYGAVCVDECVVLHQGQASSGGGYNDFIMFHGVRNSIWTMVKTTPPATLIRNALWVLALHGGIVVRHLRRGKFRVLLGLYHSALKGMPGILRKRAAIQRARRITTAEFDALVTRGLYERDYVRNALSEVMSIRGRKRG